VQRRLLWATLEDIVWRQAGCSGFEAHSQPEKPAAALAEMFDGHFLLLGAYVNRPVGASRDQESSYLLFNLDLANGHFHSYPILEAEYRQQRFQAYLQGWNYGLEP
jgi:hypothetical protein